ncbi:hypothetical protein [Streptomyces sp. NPDC087437]|uniref:hypothetical protein n=1 Tax=Streptomyces sp. NPDC087437 TaxID=3365789 RepID=UPI0038022412
MSRDEQAPEERSPLAGGCVLVAVGGGAGAAVFAASTEAGILAVWAVGVAAVWWSARRPVSDSSATPPPPSGATVYAGETGEIERVREGPGEGLLILYPVREETTRD